jgi:non-canonical purine NTP pyrophosphatase (RdgB/HAM1 family)
MLNDLIFVTSNDNKAREVASILGFPIQRADLDLDEIQEMDLVKIVEYKARQAYEKLQKPVLVEDVAFYIDAWRGFPGPFIKWIEETMGYNALPALVPKENRNVEYKLVYGIYDGKTFQTFEASTPGTIPLEPRGSNGWGLDFILIPEGQEKTLSEMTVEEKLASPHFSARRLGLSKLKAYLSHS